jgi:hypothetical protein|nr:MAG TPA: hypothetical protein [Caudoviricetes sp.]
MNKTIEIAGKSYEVESYSDERKIYVEAGELLNVVTEDNAEEVVSDLIAVAEGIAFDSARSMIESESVPYGECMVMMSFSDINGESVYLSAEVEVYADESFNGKIRTITTMLLPECPYDEDSDNYQEDVAENYECVRYALKKLDRCDSVRSDEMDEIIEANHNWGANNEEQD